MKKIVCFGEVLWDMLPTGKKLGGAPLNVALRAQSFGHSATMISAIGDDAPGREIIELMKSHKANIDHVQVSEQFDTSEVAVTLSESGSASYEIKLPCAWDDVKFKAEDVAMVKAADAFIFGSLIARQTTSRNTLFELLEHAKFSVFDVNLRPPHYSQETLLQLMNHANFIKFNDEEILEICQHDGFNDDSIEACVRYIAEKTNTDHICVTLGDKGALYYSKGSMFRNMGYKIIVADTVGAGDSFLATLVSYLLNDEPPQVALDYACAVGATVASKSGANATVTLAEVESLMNQ